MTVTIPRGAPAEVDGGYGRLDQPRRRRPSTLGWIIVAAVLVAAVLGWFAFIGTDTGPPAATTAATTAPTLTATAATPTATEPLTSGSALAPFGWAIGGDLADYITEPVVYGVGTVEGDVEVAFVNSVIATARANANPTAEEPELAYWQTGFSLRATRDTQRILVEDGQVIVPGPATFIEIENVTLRGDDEADLEYCALLHDYNVVVANPDDRVESLGTLHAVERLVRAADGHWQSSELIRTIQNVDGFGACLDGRLVPDPGQG